jgi:hypothetical protein
MTQAIPVIFGSSRYIYKCIYAQICDDTGFSATRIYGQTLHKRVIVPSGKHGELENPYIV